MISLLETLGITKLTAEGFPSVWATVIEKLLWSFMRHSPLSEDPKRQDLSPEGQELYLAWEEYRNLFQEIFQKEDPTASDLKLLTAEQWRGHTARLVSWRQDILNSLQTTEKAPEP